MEQPKPASVLSLFDTTKLERNHFKESIIEQIEDGYANPLDIHYRIKCMEELINSIKEDVRYKELLMNEAYKNGEKFQYKNADIAIRDFGKYDYSSCNDSEMNEIIAKESSLKKEKEKRAEFLKKLPPSGVVNPDTGELIYPPKKNGGSSVVMTMK